jgi:DNA recombination protein RmuC
MLRCLRSPARLSGDFRKFQDECEQVGKHLTNTKTRYDDADKRLAKFSDKLQSLSGTEAGHVIEETKKLPL